MKIVDWLKGLWDNDEEEIEHCCPRCGSKDIGYFSVISNFVQVIRDIEKPKYLETIKCTKCGFTGTKEDLVNGK